MLNIIAKFQENWTNYIRDLWRNKYTSRRVKTYNLLRSFNDPSSDLTLYTIQML
jgi:hypothetical protein